MTKYLFLDTATKYTGYAVYEKMMLDAHVVVLSEYGLLKGSSADVDSRILLIGEKFMGLVTRIKPVAVVQEFPYFQAGVRGTHAARQGDTLQLARLCGNLEREWNVMVMEARSRNFRMPLMHHVKYNQWNGQLPKKVTCERCALHFGICSNPNSIENNWVDAIMMGKWFLENRLELVVAKGKSPNVVHNDY